MAGLVPAIHVLLAAMETRMVGRQVHAVCASLTAGRAWRRR